MLWVLSKCELKYDLPQSLSSSQINKWKLKKKTKTFYSVLLVIYKNHAYMWGLSSITLVIFFTSAFNLPLKCGCFFKYPTIPLQELVACRKNLNLLEILLIMVFRQKFIKCSHFPRNVWGYLENISQSPLFKGKHSLCL